MQHEYWYGTEASFHTYKEALEAYKKAAPQLAKMKMGGMEIELPDILTKQGNVGVITINGFLTAGTAGFMRLFGMQGYDDIAEAAVEAVKDKDIKKIVLNMSTPGGQGQGLDSLGDLLSNIAQVKPMTTYAQDMCSAGYWLGSAGRHIMTTKMGEVGSIGVVIVAQNEAKRMENLGIETKVIRSGKYKMLGNPYEAFSEEFLAEAQAKVDYLNSMFTERVSQMRGVAPGIVESTMGQGRVFIGQQAVDVGLADSVGDFSDAIYYAKTHDELLKAEGV